MSAIPFLQADSEAADRLAENLGIMFGPVALQGVRAAFARHRHDHTADLVLCAEILAGLEDGEHGRTFPTKQDCAFARAALSRARNTPDLVGEK